MKTLGHIYWFLAALMAFFVLIGATGCNARRVNGATWYNPATWFSGSEGRKVDALNMRLGQAMEAATKEAQRASHETKFALAAAPVSRAVEVARESNAAAVSALDQVAGPLAYEETAALQLQVERLLSDNAELRAQGENDRAIRRSELASATNEISDLRDRLKTAEGNLQSAFVRENALANKHRNLIFGFWALAVFAVLVTAGFIYVKFALGGIPMALGRGLTALRAANPQAGELATNIFDGLLNRSEQRRIASNT